MSPGRAIRTVPIYQPMLSGWSEAVRPRSHRLSTPHDHALDCARQRLWILMGIALLIYVVIACRVSYLTLASDGVESGVTFLESMTDPADTRITVRSDITDRHGAVLATSLPTMSLCADGRRIINAEEAEQLLIDALPDINGVRLRESLKSEKSCAVIKRHLTPAQQYEVNRLGIAGLEFQPDERRVYPMGPLTSHVVGFTDIDNNGLGGIEKSSQAALLSNVRGGIKLSLDMNVQTVVRRELQRSMAEFQAIGATGVVMDAHTGEVVSLVSLPDFDPQHPGDAPDDARFNRATLGVYEMGSVFKIFNTALALQSGSVHLGDRFDATQALHIGRFQIRDYHPENRWLNVSEIFVHSSNIGSALMADQVGIQKQRSFLHDLGLMQKLVFDVPEIGSPLVPSVQNWTSTTLKTVAYGHGIAVNAVQLVAAVATMVNGGYAITPTLLKKEGPPPESDRPLVISSRTSSIMRGLLRLVVVRGTAKKAETPGYLVGGKTGTADKLTAGGRYNDHARISSFIGAFPINAPRYIVFAMLDDPKGTKSTGGYATGGMVAAPVVSKIVAQIGPMLGVSPLSKEEEALAERDVLRPISGQSIDGIPVDGGLSDAPDISNRLE